MHNPEIIGFIAGLLVSVSVLPQIVKSYKTKSTNDIALSWNAINLAGQSLWIMYGIMIASTSLIVMSSITLLMNLSMIILKLRFDKKIKTINS